MLNDIFMSSMSSIFIINETLTNSFKVAMKWDSDREIDISYVLPAQLTHF